MKLKKYISRFHYLTQDHLDHFSVIGQVQMACENGAKWIQLRIMPVDDTEWIGLANHAAAICDDWGTTLILNDNVHVALAAADVQGVHLGRGDMHPAEARRLLGDEKIIGGSALHLDDIRYFAENGADYISIGPFKHTTTKALSTEPIGIPGIEKLVESAQAILGDLDIPLIVAGGVREEDVEAILATGVHGIAVSSAINKAEDPAAAYRSFYKKLL